MNKKLIRFMTVLATCMLYFIVSSNYVTKASAAGNYYIQVNKKTNVVTVFKNNGTPYKAFLCSTGSATPIGTFYTPAKYRWHTLMGPSYGQYCTRIASGFLFHSVWYYQNGNYASQSTVEYNKLGTTCSHGCVRLSVADAKWIYDNCPLKTKVKIINGTNKNDPLGKPKLYKVSTKSKKGWDPTDPNTSNPYRSVTISGVQSNSTSKDINSTINIKKGITAKDKAGNNLTSYIKVQVKVPTSKKATATSSATLKLKTAGTYEITYTVTSPYSKVTKKIVKKYVVKETKKTSNATPKQTSKTVKTEENGSEDIF